VETLLAQQYVVTDDGSTALTVVVLVGMLIPVAVLGYVCWIFWKAKKRDEAEERRRNEWRNAPSS
jgi:cytochrome bd-type quinol oxidase subunit 2